MTLTGVSPAAAAAALALVGGVTLYGALVGKRSYAWLFVGLTFAMILLDKLEHPGLVPGLAVLAAAAQVRHGVDASLLEPG